MSRSPFEPSFAQLPATLPIFPLTGVLLLPGGRLPLNIFEPRYLAMTRDALAAARLIGMVQPQDGQGDAGEPPRPAPARSSWPKPACSMADARPRTGTVRVTCGRGSRT